MAMRIVWALLDSERVGDQLVALFEAENLLDQYRDYCLRKWYDELTAPGLYDTLPGEDEDPNADRLGLLNYGFDAWRNDQTYATNPRFRTQKYELWNSVPPNVERLVVHFDT